MTCVICKQGRTNRGHTTVTLQHGSCVLIFKTVPADVCDNCGEFYLDESVTQDLMQRADAAVRSGAEVEIVSYAA